MELQQENRECFSESSYNNSTQKQPFEFQDGRSTDFQNEHKQSRLKLVDLTNTSTASANQRINNTQQFLKSQGQNILGCQTPQNLEINKQTYKENIQPQFQINLDVSKSADLTGKVQSQKGLIESCLTFNGDNNNNLGNDNENENEEDIAFFTQAMQPDKIFDLPLALVKVQKAFNQSNQNVVKLKDSLEQVLKREYQLQQQYDQLKKQKYMDDQYYQEEILKTKTYLKSQLQEYNNTIQDLQNQNYKKDSIIYNLRDELNNYYQNEQNLIQQLELWDNKQQLNDRSKEALEQQLERKETDIKELKEQFQMLQRAEEISSNQIEKLTQKYKNEVQCLQGQIQEQNMVNDVLQKDLECVRKEKKVVQESEENLMEELHQLRYTLKQDIEKKYVDLLEYKKAKDYECEELNNSLSQKNYKIIELTKKVDYLQNQNDNLENSLHKLNKENSKSNYISQDALSKQREQYEQRMKEMEEEVTKITINRYKTELEQKQKFLKLSKKYDEQIRELRNVLGYFANRLCLKDIPEYIQQEMEQTINDIDVGSEMERLLNSFENKLQKINSNKQVKEESSQFNIKYEKLMKAYQNELFLRRQLHNKLQEIKGNIRVLCRVRPFLKVDQKQNKNKCSILKNLSQNKIMITNEQGTKEHKFQFDRIFEPNSQQNEISEEVQQLVLSSLDGFNVCILAYGQTGSGKTYTMIGNDENPGLYFSSVDYLIGNIQRRRSIIDYELGVSFVEIYNESLKDLLSKKGQKAGNKVNLRENTEGLTNGDQIIRPVKSKNQILQALREACLNRTIGVTNYNEQSSRSHFIFTIHVQGRHKQTNQLYKGKLNLIDLAGSERILKSHAEGERVKEALNINQSLTTLGKVFLSLLNKSQHIPYRDSKLTHYLKDSLGGQSKTMMIIQVNPCIQDYGESLSSLNFGQRVSQIEKGMIRATIESPSKYLKPSKIMKRCKSSHNKSQRKSDEFEIEEIEGIFTPNSQHQSYFNISSDHE